MIRVFNKRVRTRLLKLQGRSFGFKPVSKITSDFRQTLAPHQLNREADTIPRGKFVNQIPDYEVTFEDIAIEAKQIEAHDAYKEHPIETDVRRARLRSDVFQKLKDNQIIMTNLPLTDHPLQTVTAVEKFLKDKVHRDLTIDKVEFIKAVSMLGENARIAYIVVTLGSKRQAYMAKNQLRKEWIEDSLLKIKVIDDLKREHFNNRTILVREIPRYLRIEHVVGIFGQKYGAVVNVELPTEFRVIKETILEQNNRVGTKADDSKVASIRAAELQIKQSLAVDQEYQAFLKQNLDEETADSVIGSLRSDANLEAPEALDQERVSSLITMVTHLQAEGQHVLQNKLNLLNLKSKHSVIDNQRTETNEQIAADFVMENSNKIRSVLTYLEKTKSESEVVASSEDFLSKLLNLTKGELMYAYDELIKELEYREIIVSERLKDSVEHFKDNERILMEGKDWSKETDDVPNPYVLNVEKIEQIISVNQQVQDIYQVKKLTPQEKLYRILHKELNPFLEGNFNERAIANADQDLAREYKYSTLPFLLQNKTRMREQNVNTQFIPEFQEHFDDMLKRLKTDFEIPFDEIYHREKQVITDVIAAQKLLEAKQLKLKNPMSHKILDQKLLTVEQRANIQQLLDTQKPRFEQSLDREQERALASQIEKLDKTLGMAGKYSFAENDEQKWRAMVDGGELTESDLNKLIQIRNENATQNLGYSFITFSHSDEARLMLMQNKKPFFMEDKQVEFDLKSQIDHGDLDMQYTIQRSKNDSLLIEELEALREAKKNLREFEKGMDKVMPKNKKLKMFQERTKDLLEDHEFETRSQKIAGDRDEMDSLKLDRKIKELEKKFPNVNLTQLYATEQAEAAKQTLHKKAYASYKAFQFLKHGVKTFKDSEEDKVNRVSKAQQRLIDNDPYNFPLMDQTVHRILTKDVMAPTAIDKGERIDKPGRRQGITSQEYLESYFGKDMLRQPRQKVHDDSMFTFQKTLKEKYPMEQFLRLPEEERKMKIIEDLGMDFDYKKFPQMKFKNDKIQHIIDEQNDNFQDQLWGDQKFNLVHPTDPSRNLVDDLIIRTEAELKKTEREDKGAELYPAHIEKIRRDLKKEYNLPNSFNYSSIKTDKMWEKFNKGKLMGSENMGDDENFFMDEKAAAKFETVYDKTKAQKEPENVMGFGEQELDEAQSQLNKEFYYKYKQRPQSVNTSINDKVNDRVEKEYLKKSIQERMQTDQQEEVDVFNDILKDEALIKQAGNKYGADNFQRHRIGMDRVEDRFTKHKRGKGLQEFFAKDDPSDIPNSDQEQNDMDVYEHYRQQVDNLPKSKKDEERINKFKIDQEALQPDMPRLNDYFDSKSKGLHPFDHITNNFDDSEVRTANDDEFEKEEEAALYKRELMGRLMGQKLTPRQFEVISGQFRSVDAKLDRVQDAGKAQFLDHRDQIRLVEEKLEGMRRKMVQQGKWTEENSKKELQEVINKFVAECPGPVQQARIDRERTALYESLRNLDNPESLFEKEFHFDENVGVSLADHLTKLRKQYPGATVYQRRDRDGYAIIKVSFKPEYKYDLEHLTNFNLEHEKSKFLESMEELLKKMTKGVALEDLVDQEQIATSIQSIAQSQQMVRDVSAYAMLKLNQLVKERVNGIYKNDNAGFVEEVFSLFNDEKAVTKSKTAKQSKLFDLNESQNEQKSYVDMIFEDRDRFRLDMADQIRRRMLKHDLFTKRKESDFIRPKVNEKETFEDQSLLNDMNIDYLEGKNNEMEANDIKNEDFDKQAYYKLKDELKMRKETKERLLSQGIPQFKAYMRF